MKEALLAAVLGGVLAGAVSAGFVATFLSTPPPEESGASLQPSAVPSEDAAIAAGMADLEDQLTELSMRLASLEAHGPRRVAARPADESRGAADPDGAQEMLASLALPGSAVDPVFQSKVAAALERIEEERAQDRQQEEFERIQEEVEERLERLQPELGLDAHQRGALRTTLVDERVRRGELMRSMREERDFPREEFRQLREDTENALRQVLSPAQLESYEEAQRSERRRFFGRGPGGGWERGGRGDRAGGSEDEGSF